MDAVFKKLNYKVQKEIVCINHPASFQVNLDSVALETNIKTDIKKVKEIEFALIFVVTQAEVNKYVQLIATKLKDDAILWMCYPKGTSKKYKCDFNRDTG